MYVQSTWYLVLPPTISSPTGKKKSVRIFLQDNTQWTTNWKMCNLGKPNCVFSTKFQIKLRYVIVQLLTYTYFYCTIFPFSTYFLRWYHCNIRVLCLLRGAFTLLANRRTHEKKTNFKRQALHFCFCFLWLCSKDQSEYFLKKNWNCCKKQISRRRMQLKISLSVHLRLCLNRPLQWIKSFKYVYKWNEVEFSISKMKVFVRYQNITIFHG